MSNGNGTPPKTLPEWIRYLHAVRAIPPTHPDYADAQEAVRFALGRIRNLNAAASSKEQGEAEQPPPISAFGALGKGLLHGASLGLGEPIAGALAAAIPGGMGFREGAAQYREGLENIGTQHPAATVGGELGGMVATSMLPGGQAVRGGTTTAAAIPSTRAGIISRFLTGAGQTNITPAATLGALQGFSMGGEDPGDINARLRGAATGGAIGAAGAAFLGGLGALRVPRWLNQVKREIRRSVPKNTPADEVEKLAEARIRRHLVQRGYNVTDQDRILAAWRAGKKVAPAVKEPPAPVHRPGETITPPVGPVEAAIRQGLARQGMKPDAIDGYIRHWKAGLTTEPPVAPRPGEAINPIPGNPRGFEVTGPAPPLNEGPFPPTAAEMQGFNMAPTPKPSVQPPMAPTPSGTGVNPQQQMTMFVDYLKASQGPQDAIMRLGTLRQMGLTNLPQEADLLAALGFPQPK